MSSHPSSLWAVIWAAGFLAFFSPLASAESVAIRPCPVLTATLTSGMTYEVQVYSNSSWSGTGILLAGAGSNTVRLDGWDTGNSYQLAQIGSAATITPAVTQGLTLTSLFTNATQVNLLSLGTLNGTNWTNFAYAFPDARGALVTAVHPPLGSAQFFRGQKPTAAFDLATATYYAPDLSNNLAGFGLVVDDMPQFYRTGYVCAVCPNFYSSNGVAAAAGECYEFTGPAGTATAMIVDTSSSPPMGTCDAGRPYFDLGVAVYTNIFAGNSGMSAMTYRLVPAPVTNNVKLVTVNNASGYYIELRPYNYRAGITNLEIAGPVGGGTGGNWLALTRQTYNSFTYSGTPPGYPLRIRITSRFGESVYFPPLNSLNTGDRLVASNQFSVFPTPAAPVWFFPPVFTDDFGTLPGTPWTTAGTGGTGIDTNYTADAYAGTTSLRITNFVSGGTANFYCPQYYPGTNEALFQFAIKSATTGVITNLQLCFSGTGTNGLAANSYWITLPVVSNEWRVLQVPLQPADAPAVLNAFTFSNAAAASLPPVLLDNVYFVKP